MKTAEEIGRGILERFRHHNEARHEEGLRLRQAIQAVRDAHPNQHLNARQVLYRIDLNALGRSTWPSLRAVQFHLKHLRNSSALRNTSG